MTKTGENPAVRQRSAQNPKGGISMLQTTAVSDNILNLIREPDLTFDQVKKEIIKQRDIFLSAEGIL